VSYWTTQVQDRLQTTKSYEESSTLSSLDASHDMAAHNGRIRMSKWINVFQNTLTNHTTLHLLCNKTTKLLFYIFQPVTSQARKSKYRRQSNRRQNISAEILWSAEHQLLKYTVSNKRSYVHESQRLQLISYLGLITHRAMETYEWEEAQSHAFCTSLLGGSWACTASIMCERAPCVRCVGSPSPCQWGLRTEIIPKPVTESQTRQLLSM